jgi:hypothetical protein
MGAAGSAFAQRKLRRQVRATVERYAPPAIADRARRRIKYGALNVADNVRDAIDEGRGAASARQLELHQKIAGTMPAPSGLAVSSLEIADGHRASVIELHPGHPSGSRTGQSPKQPTNSARARLARLRRRS